MYFRDSLDRGMSKFAVVAGFGVLLTVNALTATLPIYVNNSPVISPPQLAPQIDATIWANRSIFNVTTIGSFGSPIPYESINTLFFTNAASGVMNGVPGFRFFQNVGGQRLPMDTWVNDGFINADNNGAFSSILGLIFISDSRASIVQVAATNIVNTGPLVSAGSHGLVRFEGANIDLSRAALRTGAPLFQGGIFVGPGGFIGSSNYVNDFGMTDLYWGAGRGNALAANRISTIRLDGLGGSGENFNLPNPSSPIHEVLFPGFGTAFSTTTVPGGFFLGTNTFLPIVANYTAAAYTNSLNATSRIVQVVFYPTNNADTNFTTTVNFLPAGGPATVVVAFNSIDFDISTQSNVTESVFLIDGMAVETNLFLSRNLNGATRRPSTYVLTRTPPFSFFFSSTNGNTPFDPTLLYNSTFALASVTNDYAAYAADVSLLSSAPTLRPFELTNAPGRIEILGDRVNLDQTRVRADSAFILKANNLASNRLAVVDAPFVNLDVRSVEPQLVISNVAPTTVRRVTGTIRAWSGKWQNFEAAMVGTNIMTNTVEFHVLIVDSQLRAIRPVVVNEFAARGNDLVISDNLNIGRSFLVEGDSLHVQGGISLPQGFSLGSSNVINVLNFTNDGIINVFQEQQFGTDRPEPYLNYVNRGTNVASSHFIRTGYFENPGCLIATGGVFALEAENVTLLGNPLGLVTNVTTNIFFGFTNVFTSITATSSAPKIESTGELRITADNLTVSNSVLRAGTLILDISNSLVDSGEDALNQWEVTSGFSALQRPDTSDMLDVHIRSTVEPFRQALHTWAGADVGAVPSGYDNNMAIGKLTLDGGQNAFFRFSAVGDSNALYVDYIELVNSATNSDGSINGNFFSIDPNFTIYFANANVSAFKLQEVTGGRFTWVSDFTGPLSSTNLFYASTGETNTFNIALVTSKDFDSDGDGIVNADDPEPITVPAQVVLSIGSVSDPEPGVMLSWNALAYSSNFLEFKPMTDSGDWQVLTNFVHGEFTSPVTVLDPSPANVSSRTYRLRVVPRVLE